MEELQDYDEHTQKFIVKLGINIFKKHESYLKDVLKTENKEYWDEEDEDLGILLRENEKFRKKIENLEGHISKLEKNLEKKTEKVFEIREEMEKNNENKIKYFKNEINDLKNQNNLVLSLFKDNVKAEVDREMKFYKEKISELEEQNKYYYDLYVDKSKGKKYEYVLYENMMDFNNKYLGNMWDIEHIGSNLSEKCDIIVKHKLTGDIILIDSKNNISSCPVGNIDNDKFIRDVTKDENKAIGGIMVANSSICKKKNNEVNKIQGKILVYLANFDFDNVGYIFSNLDMIIEMRKGVESGLNEQDVKNNFKEEYNFMKDRLNVLTNEERKIKKRLNDIIDNYYKLFRNDLLVDMQTETKKPIEKVEKQNEIVLNYEDLERNRKVIGKNRTKYYLIYKQGEKEVIQYFKGNAPKNKKIKTLKIQEEKDKKGGIQQKIIEIF